jgi:hypothetical protein
MAELTHIDEKLGEVMGLAQAAQDATRKVGRLLDDDKIVATLEKMAEEARETAERCEAVAQTRDGRKTAILAKARETKREAKDMMSTYLGEDADGLDGFEFLTMAEAGEVGHLEVLGAMAGNAPDGRDITELVRWALPIQERHLSTARECSVSLAAAEDPQATA